MIIIEGCDATGKTTLAKELADKLKFPYFKDGFHRFGARYYLKYALTKAYNVISDRFHLGEYVYPIIKQDGRVPLTIAQQHLVERVLLQGPSVLVYCETNEDFIADKFDTRGEDFVGKKDIKKIIELFSERYEASLLPKIKFDVQVNSVDEVLDFIVAEIDKRYDVCERLLKYESTGEYLGSPIMLVGEGYNDKTFVGLRRKRAFSALSSSSIYLHETLALNESKYYITNAKKHESLKDCLTSLHDELELVAPSKIIALGQEAGKLLKQVDGGINFHQVDHPSFRRRFKHKLIQEYADQLR